ncbi:MAG: thiamine pyrophosphate-binding protein [Gemmobacter sp.]
MTEADRGAGIKARSGAEIIADALVANGADTLFGVPGESFLGLLDAIHGRAGLLRFIACRQEGGAAFMADAHAKLTGRPGVCVVTRGPGACNASIGIHTAFQDSTPMIVLIGQVARDQREREAFQEVEFRHMFAPMAKWVAEIDSAARLPEHLSHAFHLAQSGRPGPVVLAIPEDVFAEMAAVADLPPARRIAAAAAPRDIAAIRDAIAAAERPICILGGPGWNAEAKAAFEGFAARADLPVVTSLRCQDYFDNHHPCYGGDLGIGAHPAIVARLRESDLLVVLGARLGEMTTQGYAVPEPPRSAQRLVHIHPDGDELGRVYYPDLPVVAASADVAQALAAQEMPQSAARAAWRAEGHAIYERLLAPLPQPGALDMGVFMAELAARLDPDAIIANGAGNYTGWVHKHYRFRRYRTQLAPTNGAMGYGVPAGVAAALVAPGRRVVAFAGDGCFQMNGQELGTAVQHGARVLFVVVNNGSYGTIRMHQERAFPGRVSGTDLVNPDFAALARAYGMHAETLTRTADIAQVLARALAVEGPALIEARVDPEAITTRTTLSAIRTAALAAQAARRPG